MMEKVCTRFLRTVTRGQSRLTRNRRQFSSASCDGQWFVWGSCDQGQLGLGKEYQVIPSPTFHEALSALRPKVVSVGMGHSIAVDRDGKIYAWGSNGEYQLGNGTTQEIVAPSETGHLPAGSEVVKLLAGPHQSFALVNNKPRGRRDVLAWGLIEENPAEAPVHVHTPTIYRELAWYANDMLKLCPTASYSHTFLMKSGEVFQFGQSLAPHTLPFDKLPKRVVLPEMRRGERVVDISAGWGHVLAQTNFGRVISWGSNTHGQTGHGPSAAKYVDPAMLPTFDGEHVKAAKVVAGATHSMVITADGKLYIWGSHRDGKLGLGKDIDTDIHAPMILPALQNTKVHLAFSGCDHSVVLTDSGELYSWGFGQHGALGLGDLEDQFEPRKIKLPNEGRGRIVNVQCAGVNKRRVGCPHLFTPAVCKSRLKNYERIIVRGQITEKVGNKMQFGEPENAEAKLVNALKKLAARQKEADLEYDQAIKLEANAKAINEEANKDVAMAIEGQQRALRLAEAQQHDIDRLKTLVNRQYAVIVVLVLIILIGIIWAVRPEESRVLL